MSREHVPARTYGMSVQIRVCEHSPRDGMCAQVYVCVCTCYVAVCGPVASDPHDVPEHSCVYSPHMRISVTTATTTFHIILVVYTNPHRDLLYRPISRIFIQQTVFCIHRHTPSYHSYDCCWYSIPAHSPPFHPISVSPLSSHPFPFMSI